MTCPRCGNELSHDKFSKYNPDMSSSDIIIDECEKCGGIWFDEGVLDFTDDVVDMAIVEIRKIPSGKEQYAPLACPKCGSTVMEKVRNERDRKVVMDVCPHCRGIWLDGGEFRAIREENMFLALFHTLKWLFQN